MSLVGTPEAGFSYRRGRCRVCGIAMIGEINPPESLKIDPEMWEPPESDDICGICDHGAGKTNNTVGRKGKRSARERHGG